MEKNYFKDDLKIYIVDTNTELCQTIAEAFSGIENVEVINSEITNFLSKVNVEAVVTPGNSIGMMTGGFDKSIVEYFGEFLMTDIQNGIKNFYLGEQPIATPLTVPVVRHNSKNVITDRKYIIHIPTMRVPQKIIDPSIIYSCMRCAMIECNRQYVHSVVIPAFGAQTGQVPYDLVAKYMRTAYHQLTNIPDVLNFDTIIRFTEESYGNIINSVSAKTISDKQDVENINDLNIVLEGSKMQNNCLSNDDSSVDNIADRISRALNIKFGVNMNEDSEQVIEENTEDKISEESVENDYSRKEVHIDTEKTSGGEFH